MAHLAMPPAFSYAVPAVQPINSWISDSGGTSLGSMGSNWSRAVTSYAKPIVAALVLLGHRRHDGLGVAGHHRSLVGQGGVELDVGGVLVGGDIQLFPPAHVGPHVQGAAHVGAPEIVVPHRPPGEAQPGALEHHPAVFPLDVAPGGDVQPGGVGVAVGELGVQGVDALENGHLVLPQLQGGAPAVVAHLPGKLKPGHQNPLAPGQLGEVLVQQLQVHHLRRLVVDGAVGRAGHPVGIGADEVVVHGYRVGAHPPALQLLAELFRRRRLARAGGAGQQHHRAFLHVLADLFRGPGDLVLIAPVALLHELHRVPPHGGVDVSKFVCHGSASS